MFVPVVDKNQVPLMPTKPSRARRWIRDGKATGFWKRGIYCVRLNVKPSALEVQSIAVGIDTGSKREALTVKSEDHTFLNILTSAVGWVKEAVKTRSEMRRGRRFRKTPCRQNRTNRKRGGLPPSTKARWQWKLRLCNWLCKMFPIKMFVVEDVAAVTKPGIRRWNSSFSPLEVGKQYFYSELKKLSKLRTLKGFETAELRRNLGLKKSTSKLAEVFSAHNVDSWVLANWWTGGHSEPDNKQMLYITPLQFHRRQLHRLQFSKGGKRLRYGGTMSLGFKRGSLVKSIKHGLAYVGGFLKNGISLHSVETGKRITQSATDCVFLTYNTWRARFLPGMNDDNRFAHISGVSACV